MEPYRYKYNGKEQLSRFGGQYDYGFRMYNAGLGRFLSVDPLTKKYPELMPYAFVANSPLAYREVDGRDYELIINHETKEIIIKATYYILEGDSRSKAKIEEAVGVWNSQTKFKYTFQSGDQKISYAIKFDLQVKEVKDISKVPLSDRNSNIINNNIVIYSPEVLKDYNEDKYGDNSTVKTKAFTRGGNTIYINNQTTAKDLSHEIGHTIGAGHFSNSNLMSPAEGTSNIDYNIIWAIAPIAGGYPPGLFYQVLVGKRKVQTIGN